MDELCPVCGAANETIMHMLVRCADASMTWYISPLRIQTKDVKCMSFMEWCCDLLKVYKDGEWWDIFWIIIWGLWLKRNLWMFEGKRKEIVDVSQKAMGLLGEFKKANENTPRLFVQAPCVEKWNAPPDGIYKINVDAAIFADNRVGFGAVMRDHLGEVMAASCKQHPGSCEADIAEAMAARHGLIIAVEAGLRNVILETDCIKLFYHMKKRKYENSAFGIIVRDIFVSSEQCSFIHFSHVKRQGNSVAHALAKLSITLDEMRVWLEEIPAEALTLVMEDSSKLNE